MKFSKLAQFFEKIEQTPSRNEITVHLSACYKELSAEEFDKAVYLMQGRVAPLFEAIEFGMGEKLVARCAADSLHIDRKLFDTELKKIGDMGETVQYFRNQFTSLEQKDLTVSEVFDELKKLAVMSGGQSQEAKAGVLSALIRQLDPLSCRYVVRIPLGVLRLGFSDMTVLDAYSWMLTGDKSHKKEIEKAYHVRPDLGYIGQQLKKKGVAAMKHISPALFTPILMMRAERLSSGTQIIEQIGECSVEPKYDGFRLQAHVKRSGSDLHVRLYSRNLEDVTFMFPDLVEGALKEVKADEVIFEGEAIGYDVKTDSFLPFQQTTQRKRKYNIAEKALEIPLKFFAFELLMADGKSYIDVPFADRRNKLAHIVGKNNTAAKNTVVVASATTVADAHTLDSLFDKAIAEGLEGVIAKKLDGIYQSGARGWNWIKFKRSYSSKIDDTVDCVVMGYDYGKGKRTGFGIGAFLVGAYDEATDQYLTLSKIGTGLTDEEWKELKEKTLKFASKSKPALYVVDKQMECDVWVKPSIVVEIKADEITRSTIHTAGRTLKASKSGKAFDVDEAGYALRCPRLIAFRTDKRPQDATNLKELKQMFGLQGGSKR